MPRPANQPSTRGLVVRGLGFAVAVALGVISVWMIVTRTDVTGQRIGALAGFWGLLLGASALSVGRRAPQPDPLDAPAAAVPAAVPSAPSAPSAPEAIAASVPGAQLELRTDAALERAAEAEARREFEARLTARLEQLLGTEVRQLLSQEVQQTMGQEIHALRGEIAAMRSELVEKVGGQLRLERIETTRVIGSDLEALQHEVRQLKDARDTSTFSSFGPTRTIGTSRPVLEPVVMRPASTDETGPIRRTTVDDGAASGRHIAAPREPVRAVAEPVHDEPVPVPAVPVHDEPVRDEPGRNGMRHDAAPPPEPPARPATPSARFDELAALPRLSPFTDFELDLTEAPAGPPAPVPAAPSNYRGRRRAADEPAAPTAQADGAPSRRHRRADRDDESDAVTDTARVDASGAHDADGGGSGNELLARLLQREGVR